MGNITKQLAVLGSTGSIGQQVLDVVRALPHRFHIVGLAGGDNTELLAGQINEFQPGFVYYRVKAKAPQTDTSYEFLSLEEMASHPYVDTAVIATSGKAGLVPTLAAIKAAKNWPQ